MIANLKNKKYFQETQDVRTSAPKLRPRIIETFHIPSCVRVYILKILINFYSQEKQPLFYSMSQI